MASLIIILRTVFIILLVENVNAEQFVSIV